MGLNGEQHYGVSLVGIHAGEKGHHTPDTRMVSHSLSIIGRLLIVYWPPWSFLFAHIAKVIRRTQATQAIQMSLLTCLIWTTLRLDPPPVGIEVGGPTGASLSRFESPKRRGGYTISQRPITRSLIPLYRTILLRSDPTMGLSYVPQPQSARLLNTHNDHRDLQTNTDLGWKSRVRSIS